MDTSEILTNPALMMAFINMLGTVCVLPHESGEQAAFLVRNRDGALKLIPWERQCSMYEVSYHGAIPAGSIALVHTHPMARPRPSPEDVALARRLQLPIWVISRHAIWVAGIGPEEPVAVVDDFGWTVRVPRQRVERLEASAH